MSGEETLDEVVVDDAVDSTVVDDTMQATDLGDGTDVVTSGDATAATDGSVVPATSDESWREPYESLGFRGIETPEQAQQRMIEAYRQRDLQLRETQERLRLLQSVHSRIDNLTNGNAASAPATPAQPEPTDAISRMASNWDVPDRELLAQYVTYGENGEATWKPDTPEDLRKRVQDYQLRQAEWSRVLSDPRQIEQAINTRVEQVLQSRLEGVLSQRDTQTADRNAEQQFFTENDWMFDRDPVSGDFYVDPTTGRPALSREGQQFSQSLRSVREMGVSRVSDQLKMALTLYRSNQTQARQAPAQQRQAVQPQVAQQRQSMLGRSNANPVKPTTAAGITDGSGASRTGATRESFGRSLVNDLIEEKALSV